jgi:hypothetical protein
VLCTWTKKCKFNAILSILKKTSSRGTHTLKCYKLQLQSGIIIIISPSETKITLAVAETIPAMMPVLAACLVIIHVIRF